MTFAQTTLDVLAKDLRLELRGKHALNLLLPFAGANFVLLGLALGPGRALLRPATPALIWVTLLFATLLGVRQAFDVEQEDGALEGLVLAEGALDQDQDADREPEHRDEQRRSSPRKARRGRASSVAGPARKS